MAIGNTRWIDSINKGRKEGRKEEGRKEGAQRHGHGGLHALAVGTHSDVTLPLLHMTPSQPPSQGSLAEDQLDGAFVHWLLSALRAEPAKTSLFSVQGSEEGQQREVGW
jgi:hypothetical protein